MKYLLSISLIWLNVILIVCLIGLSLSGCAGQLSPQPEIHPTLGTYMMFVPEGTKIGDVIAPEDGLYISKRILIDNMRRKEAERQEQKQKESRSRTYK